MTLNSLILLLGISLFLFAIVEFVRSNRRYRGHETRKDRFLRLVSSLGILNFIAFFIADVLLGGDALNGRVSGGHYYLGNHGSYTEVSRAIFIYSACHAVSAFLGMAAAVAAGRAWNRASQNANQER